MPFLNDAVLSQQAPRVGVCAWLDVRDDPLRFALAIAPVQAPLATILPVADPQFDGQTFTTLDPRLLAVSTVSHGPGGAEAVQFTFSGTLEMDSDLLTALSDPARFRGRLCKLWMVAFGPDWVPTHARPYYTGYMSVPAFSIAPTEQTITMVAENYLTMIGGGAPSRTQLWSPDPTDRAADATTGAGGAASALGPQWGGFSQLAAGMALFREQRGVK